MSGKPSPGRYALGGIALAVIALALLVVHWIFPSVQFDTPALVLLVLAATPMLSLFLRSVKLPGGIEVELADLRQRVDEKAKESESRDHELARQQRDAQVRTNRQVHDAILTSAATSVPVFTPAQPAQVWTPPPPVWVPPVPAPRAMPEPAGRGLDSDDSAYADIPRAVPEPEPVEVAYPADPAGPVPTPPAAAGPPILVPPPVVSDGPFGLAALADEYTQLRARMSSGPDRTRAMTVVVNRMIGIATSGAQWNPASWLDDAHPGRRLAAYAWLYARPDSSLVNRLILSLPAEDSLPFNQYWQLRAISVTVDDKTSISPAARDLLLRYATTLGKGSDRASELGFVLFQLGIEAP